VGQTRRQPATRMSTCCRGWRRTGQPVLARNAHLSYSPAVLCSRRVAFSEPRVRQRRATSDIHIHHLNAATNEKAAFLFVPFNDALDTLGIRQRVARITRPRQTLPLGACLLRRAVYHLFPHKTVSVLWMDRHKAVELFGRRYQRRWRGRATTRATRAAPAARPQTLCVGQGTPLVAIPPHVSWKAIYHFASLLSSPYHTT